MIDIAVANSWLSALGMSGVSHTWRCIHDVDRSIPPIPLIGTLEQCSETLNYYNERGYGVFVVINELDGAGLETANVRTIRAQFIDKDGDADWSTWRGLGAWSVPPTCFVVTRPGRYHAYWATNWHSDPERFTLLQRKLVAQWQSDPMVIDPPRVMRLPGSFNMKDPVSPAAVTFIAGSGVRYDPSALEVALSGVVADMRAPEVHTLGDTSLAAPSLEWASYALSRIDPNQLPRGEWLKITAAFKAAAWSWGDDVIRFIWDQWCLRYQSNDPGENTKLWRSIKDAKTGWKYLTRAAGVEAELMFGSNPVVGVSSGEPVAGAVEHEKRKLYSFLVTEQEQANYFNGCIYIASMGRILTPLGRLMDQLKFNGEYGGPHFQLTMDGKSTDEPWRAATRGQIYQIPKVDHLRFLPRDKPGSMITDELGRRGLNTYRPVTIARRTGDLGPWERHMRALLPVADDRAQFFSYLAHCAQRVGVKAFWAPVIQSTEGAGKGIIKMAMEHALGKPYVYGPNAKELTDSGGKFNAWMRSKLLIIVDEIKTDERRDMMEMLKPMITEDRIEIQAKGSDQDMEDNPANWIMFTNWKDAIPITRDSRRYAIYYSPLQSALDIIEAGMAGDYFPRLYNWMRGEGREIVADWLLRYEIDPRYDPMNGAHRAPKSSSTNEAIRQSYGRVELAIIEAVESGLPGFRRGWVSSVALRRELNAQKVNASLHAVKRALEVLGYFTIGRVSGPIFEEEMKQPYLYNLDKGVHVGQYRDDQNYVIYNK